MINKSLEIVLSRKTQITHWSKITEKSAKFNQS